MLEIFNIILTDDTISCEYIPERTGKPGKIIVDLKSEEIIEVIPSEYESDCKRPVYAGQARAKLMSVYRSGEIPERAESWFF